MLESNQADICPTFSRFENRCTANDISIRTADEEHMDLWFCVIGDGYIARFITDQSH